jgi:hypothetical protein
MQGGAKLRLHARSLLRAVPITFYTKPLNSMSLGFKSICDQIFFISKPMDYPGMIAVLAISDERRELHNSGFPVKWLS